MIYKNLCNISTKDIHEAFVLAFSDYEVKLDITLPAFETFLIRRGFSPEFSMGAFIDNQLVGFILNGYRLWNNKPTVYDTGTGVIPAYRKQGITTALFQKVKELLLERNVSFYLLEVLKNNQPAISLYQKQGFEITRELSCYQGLKPKMKMESTYPITYIKHPEELFHELSLLWDFTPTWQNSFDSIMATAPDTFVYAVAKDEDKIIGYGIIDTVNGNIPQYAVHKEYRKRGIGKSILYGLAQSTKAEKVSITNVETSCDSMVNALEHLNFDYTVGQYEMILSLTN